MLKGQFTFDGEEWDEVSKEAKDLIKKLICKPERRLTATEALQHKWFKNQISKEEEKRKLGQIKNITHLGGGTQ